MPAVLPLMRAASRSSTRRRSSTPPKRREAPSIPAAGQNVACKSPTVRICVEEQLIFGRAYSVASGSSATRKLSFAGSWYYSQLSVDLLCTNPLQLYKIQYTCSRGRCSHRAARVRQFLPFHHFHTVLLPCRRVRALQSNHPLPWVFNVFNNFGESASRSKLAPKGQLHRVLVQFDSRTIGLNLLVRRLGLERFRPGVPPQTCSPNLTRGSDSIGSFSISAAHGLSSRDSGHMGSSN
jgi:hypothetical protein